VKRSSVLLLAALLVATIPLPAGAKAKGKEKEKDKVDRLSVQYNNKSRDCYYQIPSAADAKTPLPAVVLVHNQSNYATQMTKYWHDYASQEGFIIIAPESLTYAEWTGADDGPPFFHACVAAVDKLHPIDPGRLYIFGQRGGGVYAMFLGLYDSNYYAAIAVHGAIMDAANFAGAMKTARRKIPIALWMGDRDPLITVGNAENEHDAFKAGGFPFELHVMPFTAGGYEGVADEVNEQVWKFFQENPLPGAAPAAPAGSGQ
jgi:poly(3-hydroxybutyrate) depolymerase